MWPLSLAWLLGCALPVAGDNAQWHLSNAWKEHSCDDVCRLQGLECTERCWPASVAGLSAILNAPRLSGVCFRVAEGPAKSWHPAKDADNTLCYWNPGQPSQARCPEVTQTSPDASSGGQWTRRLCPCVNQTVTAISDCGLGSEAAAPVPVGPGQWQRPTERVTTPSPVPSTPAPAPAPETTAAPAGDYVAVPQGCSLCISGFDGDDTVLNGQYGEGSSRAAVTWRKDDVLLAKGTNGHWQFHQRQLDGNYVPISQGSFLRAGSRIPAQDTFATSTGDWQVEFKSCCGYEDSAGAPNTGTSADAGNTAVIIVVMVLVAVLVIGAVVALLFWNWRRQKHAQKSGDAEEHEPTKLGPDPTIDLPVFTDDAELGGGRGFTGLRAAAAPPMPRLPPSLADSYSHGVYEGPVQPWWLEGRDAGGSSGSGTIWQVGDKVRLCGLGTNSTWNGAVGLVENHDRGTGHVHVRLPDGRLKAVKPENCESPAAPPRQVAGWRGRAEAIPSQNSTGQSQNRAPMDRGGSTSSSTASASRSGPPMQRGPPPAISTGNADAGAGVASWLASPGGSPTGGGSRHPFDVNRTPKGKRPNLSESFGESRSSEASAPSREAERERLRQQWEPPMPPATETARAVGKRSASAGPIGANSPPQPASYSSPQPAKRAASTGPSGRSPDEPSRGAMSLTPGKPAPFAQNLAKGTVLGAASGAMGQSQPMNSGLADDLIKAQKRTQAKLAALKCQLATS